MLLLVAKTSLTDWRSDSCSPACLPAIQLPTCGITCSTGSVTIVWFFNRSWLLSEHSTASEQIRCCCIVWSANTLRVDPLSSHSVKEDWLICLVYRPSYAINITLSDLREILCYFWIRMKSINDRSANSFPRIPNYCVECAYDWICLKTLQFNLLQANYQDQQEIFCLLENEFEKPWASSSSRDVVKGSEGERRSSTFVRMTWILVSTEQTVGCCSLSPIITRRGTEELRSNLQ